jgi:hypothetical protein
MLCIAKQKNALFGTQLIHSDIRTFRLPQRVDLITCNGDTFNYLLSARELAAAFARCWLHLNPGGWLIFDVLAGRTMARGAQRADSQISIPGADTRWRLRTNARRGLSAVEVTIRADDSLDPGIWRKEVHLQRWFPLDTVCLLLRRAGFELRDAFEVDTLRPATRASIWLKIVARKPMDH